MTQTPLVEMRGISKYFGGVHALADVSVDLQPGEVMGIVGHNGAGKSTLIKILSGAYTADAGEILVNGQRATIRSPRDAKSFGIETIYQALALADNLPAPRQYLSGPRTHHARGHPGRRQDGGRDAQDFGTAWTSR